MRAKEFPGLLFSHIHRAVGEPKIETFARYMRPKIEYFAFNSSQGIPFVHFGFSEDDRELSSQMGIWGWTIQDPMADDGYAVDPFLLIKGGPVNAGAWMIDKGQSLVEKVTIHGGGFFGEHSGGIDITSPLLGITKEVLDLAYELAQDNKPARLSYWEAFKDPNRDYTKPPS